jgi:hypothetical protein
MTSMFSSLSFVDAALKLADPVTTIGSALRGSISWNFEWM